jgi:hypothetical protein
MNQKKLFLFFVSTLIFCNQSKAQVGKQKLSLAAYNIGFSGITTGLGRAINKNKQEKFFPAFWKGFKHGCIGGTIAFSGKQIGYLVNKEKSLYWGWPSKIVHSYGVSVMENSATHKNLFKSIRFPVGFVMMNIDFENSLKIRPMLMPGSLTSFFIATANAKMDFVKSIKSGTPYFEYNRTSGGALGGYAGLNVFYINTAFGNNYSSIEAHELIHILQGREYLIFNKYLSKTTIIKKVNESENKFLKVFRKTIFIDIPYNYPLYSISKLAARNYYDNIFELEAQHFATNEYVRQ